MTTAASSESRSMSNGQKAALLLPAVGAAVTVVAMAYSGAAGPGGPDASELAGMIAFTAWAVVPYIALAACLVLVARFASKAWPFLVVASLAFVGYGVVTMISILRSESSTAVLGFLFVPFVQWLGLGVLMGVVLIIHLVAKRL